MIEKMIRGIFKSLIYINHVFHLPALTEELEYAKLFKEIGTKKAQEALIQAILDGKITFSKRYINRWAGRGWVSTAGTFKFYVEDSGMCGCFSYCIVDGDDLSDMSYTRMHKVIEDGVDPGEPKPIHLMDKWEIYHRLGVS